MHGAARGADRLQISPTQRCALKPQSRNALLSTQDSIPESIEFPIFFVGF